MTVSLAEATAAARRIQAGDYPGVPKAAHRIARRQDADLLAGFVLDGDTERLRVENHALKELLDLAVEWARRPSPLPGIPFLEFVDLTRAARGDGKATNKAVEAWRAFIAQLASADQNEQSSLAEDSA